MVCGREFDKIKVSGILTKLLKALSLVTMWILTRGLAMGMGAQISKRLKIEKKQIDSLHVSILTIKRCKM